MGTYYYGIITTLHKINADVIMRVGKGLGDGDEVVATCKEVLAKIRSLRGKKAWHCSTLRAINEILKYAENCNLMSLLYVLIAEELGVEPKIVDEYVYEDSNYYDVESLAEIREACDKLFGNRVGR